MTLVATGVQISRLEEALRTTFWPSAADSVIVEVDWKSTRLNSSHSQISYAVFCLKKKKQCSISNKTRNCLRDAASAGWPVVITVSTARRFHSPRENTEAHSRTNGYVHISMVRSI